MSLSHVNELRRGFETRLIRDSSTANLMRVPFLPTELSIAIWRERKRIRSAIRGQDLNIKCLGILRQTFEVDRRIKSASDPSEGHFDFPLPGPREEVAARHP